MGIGVRLQGWDDVGSAADDTTQGVAGRSEMLLRATGAPGRGRSPGLGTAQTILYNAGMGHVTDRVRSVLAGRPNVRLAYVFGSTTTGAPRAGSDVDVAISWVTRPTLEEIGQAVDELQRATDRRVSRAPCAAGLRRLPHRANRNR